MVGQTTLFNNSNDVEGIHKNVEVLSVIIEKLRMDEFNNSLLKIQYNFEETQFGKILIASTSKGVCFLSFADDKAKAIQDLKNYYPKAIFEQANSVIQNLALLTINGNSIPKPLILHLKGTEFQFMIWNRLLEIPREN